LRDKYKLKHIRLKKLKEIYGFIVYVEAGEERYLTMTNIANEGCCQGERLLSMRQRERDKGKLRDRGMIEIEGGS
jgi:hypothetical protein